MSDRDSEILAERLVSCLPAASFELETLCRLAGISASREVETAAVTCEGRSRLLINPDFVAAHCRRDEHLFLLVMHELWHVILAHTRLWPRPTPNHNIAFDAVINAGLARQHPAPEYRGFFEALNPPDAFPATTATAAATPTPSTTRSSATSSAGSWPAGRRRRSPSPGGTPAAWCGTGPPPWPRRPRTCAGSSPGCCATASGRPPAGPSGAAGSTSRSWPAPACGPTPLIGSPRPAACSAHPPRCGPNRRSPPPGSRNGPPPPTSTSTC